MLLTICKHSSHVNIFPLFIYNCSAHIDYKYIEGGFGT